MSGSQAAVLAAFPRRSFRVRKSVGASVLLSTLVCLGMLAGFLWIAFHNGAGIVRDWQIAEGAKRTPAQLVSKCKIAKAVLWECDFTITPTGPGEAREAREVSVSFVSFRERRFSAVPVASARFPGYVTTDFALEHVPERAWTAGITALLLGLAVLGLSRVTLRWWRQWRAFAALSGQAVRAVPVEVLKANKNLFVMQYHYRVPGGPTWQLNMGRKATPFLLDVPGSPPTGLAVVGPDSDIPMLLDENLTRLDFTEAERDALRRARASAG